MKKAARLTQPFESPVLAVSVYVLFVFGIVLFGYSMAYVKVLEFPVSFQGIAAAFYPEPEQKQAAMALMGNKVLIQGNSFLALSPPLVPPQGYRLKEVVFLHITGYSSTPEETNEQPYITASNQYVRWGIVATNFPDREHAIPFGTMVRIPELFGGELFAIEDRMNERFTNRMDIWFPSKAQASQFGIYRNVGVEILELSL